MRDEIGPGWFPDPAGGGGLRYWDGLTWTGFTQPPPGAFLEDQLPSSPRDRQTWPIAVLVGVVIATLLAGVITVVNHHSTSRSTASTTPSAPPSSTANGERRSSRIRSGRTSAFLREHRCRRCIHCRVETRL